MFEIVAPVNNHETFLRYVEEGISCFYGGIDIKELSGRNVSIANYKSFDELGKTIKYSENNKINFALTINARPIIHSNMELYNIYKKIKETGVKDFIVSDYMIAKDFKNFNLHISSLSPVYNSYSVSKWIENKGVKRIIFPREISIKEKINIINKFPDIEFEIFFKNDWCYISSDTCSGIHYGENIKMLCQKEKMLKSSSEEINKKINNLKKSKIDCKLCELFHYKKTYEQRKNKLYIKIVGRQYDESKILKDIVFTKRVIENALKINNYSDFVNSNIISYYKTFGNKCNYKNCVYYLNK